MAKAKYDTDDLNKMLAKGHAIKNADGDPSYPVADEDDLDKAIKAVGRGGADHDAIRKHIIKRAKALGLSAKIPDSWNADGSVKGATSSRAPLELRAQRRSSMLAVPERMALSFARGNVEMRAMANGTGGTSFRFSGYAATFNDPFQMWDMWGEEYTEDVDPGAFGRTLANKCDTAFLIGHYDAGILMARTKSGTMRLAADTRGLEVNVPAMDGGREDVRALASAVERGDMDEMSCAFVTRQQRWDDSFEHRTMLEMDLNRGDVSAVVFGANPATAGSVMTALPTEALTLRRPVSVRMPTTPYQVNEGEATLCAQCRSANDADASYCDQCGARMPGQPGESTVSGEDESQQCQSCLCMNATDAKYCDQCGSGMAGVRPWVQQGIGYLDWAAAHPGERRAADEIVDMSGAPDYNPVPHAFDPAAKKCPYAKANGCGLMNSPDAKFCDQCGGSMYDGNGVEVVDDSGVVEDIEGAAMNDAELLAHRQRRMRLLALTG
jgi:HK97 family phage prohead protease